MIARRCWLAAVVLGLVAFGTGLAMAQAEGTAALPAAVPAGAPAADSIEFTGVVDVIVRCMGWAFLGIMGAATVGNLRLKKGTKGFHFLLLLAILGFAGYRAFTARPGGFYWPPLVTIGLTLLLSSMATILLRQAMAAQAPGKGPGSS